MYYFLYLVIVSFILEAHLHFSFDVVLMTLIGFIKKKKKNSAVRVTRLPMGQF